MGLRHRSIRLRVGVLITVPVLCLLGLYGFVASITLGNAVSQQHATTLRNDLADPITAFQQQVAQERAYAMLSLANPTNTQAASALGVQESATQRALVAMTAALRSPAVAGLAAAPEKAAIAALLKASKNLNYIRGDISDDAITMSGALAAYDAIIDAGYPVIDQAVDQLSSVPVVTQALTIIDLDRASQAAQEEWDLLAGDVAQQNFPNADRLTFAALAKERQSLIGAAVPDLAPQYRAMLDKNLPSATAKAMGNVEGEVISTPWHRGAPPPRLATSKMVFIGYSLALGKALAQATDALQNQVQHNANTDVLRLVLAAGLGLLGTVVSIALSLIIGRGLVGQLRELRESALSLAHERLPSVIGRLRSGDQVDPGEYAPAETSTSNEIEQVQNAFSVVQQTAVQAAIDEARLRRGISDVFRNLAGRSQSLLHRQLTLLDGMERRATEPDELEDLFRIDHLTTRMRRHAEGLIILSGEAPARGWRQPVPLVDVLRAAVAEVEDYTRIRVLCRTSAAVAGHAVADVIHLIAELAENATVFSPPNTPVRIQGDIVGRGFAIEIEDRGLGISAARLEEINANLAHPPQFDLSGSDRLGLFIAGQLAQRHDIKITLRPSVFGGTTAIVLVPTALVVEENAAGRDPALPSAETEMALTDSFAGRHAALAQPAAESGDSFAVSGRPANALPGSGLPGGGLTGNGLARNGRAANGMIGNADADNRVAGNGVPARAVTGDGIDPSDSDLAGASAAGNSAAGNYLASSSPSGSFASETVVGDDAQHTVSRDEVAKLGLPVRVRQANLAPQLRTPPPTRGPGTAETRDGGPGLADAGISGAGISGAGTSGAGTSGAGTSGAGISGAGTTGFLASRLGTRSATFARPASPAPTPTTPEAARNTMSALQRGWQLGRSEAAAESPDSVFTPYTSRSSQLFNPYDSETGSNDPYPADSTDEQTGD